MEILIKGYKFRKGIYVLIFVINYIQQIIVVLIILFALTLKKFY